MLTAALGACALAAPRTDAPPAVQQRAFDLADGFVHVTVRIPQSPPDRKPLVLGALGLEDPLLAEGIAVAEFDVDWSRLGGADAPPAPSPTEAPASDASEVGTARAAGDDGSGSAPQRVGEWLLAAPRPGIVGRDYFALIGATALQVVPQVLDLLTRLPEIDPRRIGIAGSSTHGFVALEALAAEPRLVAGVVRVACGDYHRFLRSSSLGLHDDPRWLENGKLVLDPDYERTLRAREPVRMADRYPPRALLLLNGAKDPAMPRACAERTAEVLGAAYARAGVPERFAFVLFPDAAHDLGAEADAQVLAWWRRWLLDAPPPR